MLKASASWREWGAYVCQVSSASHFLLFLHAVISMAFLQTGHRLLPILPQICTLAKKVSARIVALGRHRKVLRVFIKGIISNWTPAPSSILFVSPFLEISHDLSHLRTSPSQLFCCPLIGFCLPAFLSVFSTPCFKQAYSSLSFVVTSPTDNLGSYNPYQMPYQSSFPKKDLFSL